MHSQVCSDATGHSRSFLHPVCCCPLLGHPALKCLAFTLFTDDQPLVPRSPQPSSGDETNSDSSNEESDDDAILGTGPLSQLADSLRAALQARMGSIGTQNNVPAPGGATSSKQEAPENDPAAKLEWRHAVASPKQKQLPKAGHHMGISIDREEGLAKQVCMSSPCFVSLTPRVTHWHFKLWPSYHQSMSLMLHTYGP